MLLVEKSERIQSSSGMLRRVGWLSTNQPKKRNVPEDDRNQVNRSKSKRCGNVKYRNHLENLAAGKRVILKCINKNWDGCMKCTDLTQNRNRQ